MMSSPIMGKGDTDDGNRPSNSGTSDKTIQLNKIILNQKGLCALDAGKQQLQNLQGCNIFILSPTQLKNLGLVAKMKNGKPVIMHESKGGSTTESITEALSINQLVPLLESRNVSPDIVALDRASVTNSEGHLEVMEVSAKSHSVKESAIVDENKEKGLQYVKMSGGVKRRRLGETAGNEQKQPELLKSKDSSEDGSVMNSDNKDKSVMSGDSVPKSMQLWRYETQRHLPRFAVHWQLALAEIGHINCPMMECNYISLSEADMFNHYLHCDGKSSIECNTCPICMCRLGTENDLKTHMLKSHPGDGFHRKTLQQVMIKNKWEVRPKVKLLAKRRSFCKVHRVSWNIAIESKGYVKCLFQNCSYLAITVDEMIKHYGICNGGGDIGGYPYPYKCPHCGGCVETEEKLRTHMEKSHTTEQSSYQTKLLPSSSKTIKKEEVLSTVTLMKPIKLETKENKDSSYCKDSFIITLNAPDGNDTDDTVCTEHIQFVSVDKIKTEVSTADGYDDDAGVQNMYPPDTGELHHYTTSFPVASVKSCRSSEMLPVNQVLAWKDDTAPKEPSGAQEEQNVAKVIGVKEIYCQKKEKADDIVIERVEKSVDSGSTDHENIPDVSIQLVKPVLFTARMESGAVNSEQTPDGSTCTVEKPVDCVSTEMDLKQHTYMENYLFSSDLSSSEQSDDIDVKPDIIENDTLSYLNMHHVKQYSSIYSNDSYKGKFYRKMKSEVDCVADILGAGVAEQFDGCKNMEHQSVNDDRGIASRSVLKTYSRRAFRALSNTTEFRFSSKSVKGVTCLKKEESDITAGQLNEPVDQCGGQGTFHDNCSDNNITRSHLRDAGSTGLFSIVDKQRKADSDVWEKIETCQNAQKSRSSSGAALIPEGISELVSGSECVNNMETNISTVKDTEVLQSGRKIYTHAIVTSYVPERKSEHRVSSEGVDTMENDVSTVMDTEALQSGRKRDTNSGGTDCVPEGKTEHCVGSECVDAMETDVSTMKDAEVLQSGRRRDTSLVGPVSIPEGNSEHTVSSECVDGMQTNLNTVKDTEILQSERTRDTSSVGTDCVPEGNSEHCISSECVDTMETNVSTVKDTEVPQSERTRDTNSVGTDCVTEGNSEHCVSSECVDTMETDVSTLKDTELLQSGRTRDINSVETDCVPEGNSEHCISSECVDAMETVVSAVKDTEVLQSGRARDTNSVGTDCVPEGNPEHCDSSECVDAMETDVSTVKDTEVLKSGRTRDTNSVGTDCVSEGISEHCVSSECVDAMETEVSTVKDTEVLKSGRTRDTNSVGTDCVPEGNSEHCVGSECVDAMETDVSTVKDTEVVQSGRTSDTHSVGTDCVPEGISEHCVSSESVDVMGAYVSIVKDSELQQSGGRRDTSSVGPDSVPEGNMEHTVSSECVDAMETDVSTVKNTEVLQSGRRKDTNSVEIDRVSEGKLVCHAGSECVDAQETNISIVKDAKVMQSKRKRETPSRHTAHVHEGNSKHHATSECMHALETDINTLKDTEVMQCGRTSIGAAHVSEENLTHSASSESVDTIERNVSTVKDTEIMQSEREKDAPLGQTAHVPEGNSKHHAISECVDGMKTVINTLGDTEVMLQSERRRDSHSVGTAHVTEGNLDCHASLECVDIMEMNISIVKDTELMQSERRRDEPSIGTAHVPEGNLECDASSECLNAMKMTVSTVKDTELMQLERRRETPSIGTAHFPEGNLAHCASSECVDTMETNIRTVKDTKLVQSGRGRDRLSRGTATVLEGNLEQSVSSEFVDAMETSVSTLKDTEVVPSGRRRGRLSRGTATVLEGNLEQSVSSEFVDAMETSVSTLKDTEVVPSGRRRGRPSRGTASVPEGRLAHLASAECMDTMEMNVSTVKDEKVVQSGKRRGRPPKVTASVREGKLELISSPGYVDAMQANVSTVKRAEVVQCGRRRGRPPKVTASVAEGNLARCASSECMDTMEMNVSTVKDTEVLQSGRKRGRPPKVTACVPEGNLAHYVSSECKDTMETNVSTMKDTEIVHSGRRRGRPPKVTASVAEGNVEHCASSEYVDIMEPNPSTVIETERRECGQSGRRRGRPPRVRASVSEGSLELISVPECVDSMETDDNILNGTKRQQNGQSVRSGRGRGRSRGRGCRGRGRNSLAQHVLRKERELEQSADGDSLLKVKCGKCSEEMQKKFFERHNRMKHCGLGWIEGADPIDLNDEKSLLRILTKVHHTRKWLTCETCGANKRSVVGFISHLQCCQKSIEERQMMKMECEICGRSMLPVSLKVHMSTVHKNPPKVEEVITLEELEEQSKMKRAAATKAVSRMQEFIGDEDVGDGNEQPSKHFDGLYLKVESRKINNFTRGAWKRSLKQLGKVCCRHVGCNVESKTLEEALEHYLNCSMAPKKGYVCRTCSFHCEEEPEMLSHVTSAHGNSPECSDNSDADSESELETEDEEKPSKKKPRTVSSAASRYKAYAKLKTANKMKFLLKESSGPVVGDKPYVPAVKWTLTFRLENYMQSLYPNIHSTPDDWIALTSAAAAQYLPHTAESVQISRLCMKHKVLLHPQKAVKQWKRLKLFEAEVIDGIPMFFAGGPVWAMAWCPVPLQTAIYRTTHTNQYLAVSCHSGMEDKYISGQSYSHSGLIQIWDFGHLDNQQPCSIPKLAVGIAHDYGAVWCMEWCPSGCYDTLDEEVPKCGLRRLGLLGAACSDGTVRIFSICFPSELQDKVCGSIPIFKVEAVRTLVLDDRQTCLLGDSKWQCTRLSWYKGKGHRIIAGCFTNGMVAVWDIATESPLLSKRVGKSYILYPYHSFQAHIGVVSAIALSPQDDGRYLMTGSFDRTTKYWDLEDTSAPITVSKRGSITDGVWLTHWVSAVNSFDDSYSLGHANGTLTPVRQFGFGSYPLLAQNSVAWSLSTCDWMNAVAQSTLAGELTVIFSHQLLIAVDSEKGMRDKRMIISYTDIMHLEDQKEEGSENGDVAEKPNTSQNSASAGLPNEHDVMDVDDAVHINSGCAQPLNVHVDHSSGDRKSQLSFEDMFPKLGSRDSMPVLREGNSAGNMDMNANNCDVSISGSDNARTEGPNTEFRSVDQSPSESLNVSVQSDIESKESAITRNLTHSTLTDSVTYTDRFQNINVSSRTSGLSQYDLSVTDSADAERSFSRESSMAIESMSKADESMKNNVDCPEKMDQDSDKTKDSTGAQVVSYDQAHKKCGLILCDFPTGNLKHMPHEARLWMRQSDKMKTADVDAYPLGSINRVSWNPNCRSFLWLAAGYHCGLVRVPCMQAMYCKPIEDILQHGERKVAALLNKVSKDLQ